MDNTLFDQLISSVKQAGAIHRGDIKPKREQGRRKPREPAKALLSIVHAHPEVILKNTIG